MTFGKIGAGPMVKSWSAGDYVRDGLVTMWDGIENAGRGVHDPNATNWKSLIGNFDLTIDDPNAYWTANSLSRDTLGGSKVLAYYQSVIPNVVTLEICCLVTAKGSPSAFLLTNGEVSYGNQQNVCVNSRTNGVQTAWGKVWTNCVKTTGPYYVSARWDSLYVDAIPIQNGWTQEAVASGTNRFNVFGRAYSGNYNLAGNVHSIRIYSRALTAAEIAYNYNIDKMRFNLL